MWLLNSANVGFVQKNLVFKKKALKKEKKYGVWLPFWLAVLSWFIIMGLVYGHIVLLTVPNVFILPVLWRYEARFAELPNLLRWML